VAAGALLAPRAARTSQDPRHRQRPRHEHRCKQVKAVGDVTSWPPRAKSGYYPLTWIEPGSRLGRTAGKTLTKAGSKSAEIDQGASEPPAPRL
jgi:hypothetical protein